MFCLVKMKLAITVPEEIYSIFRAIIGLFLFTFSTVRKNQEWNIAAVTGLKLLDPNFPALRKRLRKVLHSATSFPQIQRRKPAATRSPFQMEMYFVSTSSDLHIFHTYHFQRIEVSSFFSHVSNIRNVHIPFFFPRTTTFWNRLSRG